MKMPLVIILLCALTAASCGYDRFGEPGASAGSAALPNADLSLLYLNYYGEPFVINENMVFEGYVISDDREGNFFRSFIIDDGTAAVEIRAGFYDLHSYCQRGRRIALHAQGLAVGMYNGIIQTGLLVNVYSPYRVEEFGSRIILDGFIERDNKFGNFLPLHLGINELQEIHCGRLVRISGLSFFPGDGLHTWAQPATQGAAPVTGINVFADEAGNTVSVVTSGYASFAGERVPTGKVSLTGILMYGKFGGTRDGYVLKLRDLDDVEE